MADCTNCRWHNHTFCKNKSMAGIGYICEDFDFSWAVTPGSATGSILRDILNYR